MNYFRENINLMSIDLKWIYVNGIFLINLAPSQIKSDFEYEIAYHYANKPLYTVCKQY